MNDALTRESDQRAASVADTRQSIMNLEATVIEVCALCNEYGH